MGCCDDPHELIREQEHYGKFVRDLFTDDPEKVILKQLNEASTSLRASRIKRSLQFGIQTCYRVIRQRLVT